MNPHIMTTGTNRGDKEEKERIMGAGVQGRGNMRTETSRSCMVGLTSMNMQTTCITSRHTITSIIVEVPFLMAFKVRQPCAVNLSQP